MKVDILCEGKVIGQSNLDATDPPMGVAAGRFIPTPDYDQSLHAYVIDGEDNELGGSAKIVVRSDKNGMLPCVGVVIEDHNETLQEINLTVLGIPYPQYETIFGAYPAYRAYWRADD